MRAHRIALSAVLTVGLAAGLAVSGGAPAQAATRTNPYGYLDTATVTSPTGSGGTVTLTGWSADPDSAAPVRVSITLDGATDGSVLATGYRPDVGRMYPAFGNQRGYTITVPAPAGPHTLCTVATNLGPGQDMRLGCKTVTVPGPAPTQTVPPAATRAPYGAFDSVKFAGTPGNGTFTLAGWSTDPDTTAPTLVDLSVGGLRLASVVANAARPDVAKVYPAYGPAHGFVTTVPATLAPGNYWACVVAINTAAGQNKAFSCRMVTVPPVGVPATLGVSTAASAADALQAQALASRAAGATDFPAGASSATRISIAARALLQQAAGRRAAPPANSALPPFTPVTTAKPVDEQAVMGKTPNLGSYPPSKTGGRTGSSRAIELFANDALPAPSSAGDGLVGAAPVLPANGTTVRPTLPTYPVGYQPLRAEVALDAALSQLGVPYVYAAAGPASFDCSGLTQWAWAKAGVSLYHYTGTQAVQGVRVQPNQLLPGDLVLFGSDLHHVGMYLGAGYMIDAPYTGAYVRVDQISWYGDFSLAVRP